ncbi:GNAT family N-acetyltransferase [Pseudogemmobacter sonorensis]|uniref:GNAT family N-acetyltransferase n=1 Tax=Pseudogemmobacter sonorensis TaxID=2989681 RepID=UPI00369CE8C1
MGEITVTKETGTTKGRYVIARDGEEAELTFSIVSPVLVIADHTGVPDSFRGTGAGRALFEALVKDARENGFKVMPLCPFVNALRRKHPETADVFSV